MRQKADLLSMAMLALVMACTPGAKGSGSSGGESGAGGLGGDASLGGEGGQNPDPGGTSGTAGSAGEDGGEVGGGTGGDGQTSGGTSGSGGQAGGGSGGSMPNARAETCIKDVHPICADDFERYTVGQAPPTPFQVAVSPNNKLVVANDKAVSGTKSIRIDTTPSGVSTATMGLTVSALLTGGKKKFYSRMMLWMGGLPGTNAEYTRWSLLNYANVFTGGSATISFGGIAEEAQRLLYYGNDTSGLIDCHVVKEPLQIPLNKWICVELSADPDRAVQYEVLIDGQVAMQASTKATGTCQWTLGRPISASFGWNHVHTQSKGFTMWIDDIAVSEQKIGCAN